MDSADDPTVIPASRRPDGTLRKERRVKSGYVPPDEAAKYQSKGKKFVSELPSLPPGYVAPTEQTTPLTKNQKKNMRKKKNRIKKAEGNGDDEDVEMVNEETPQSQMDTATSETKPSFDNTDTQKKIKALRKKLRQVEQLEERNAKGEDLDQEQLGKIEKKNDFLKELENLESELE